MNRLFHRRWMPSLATAIFLLAAAPASASAKEVLGHIVAFNGTAVTVEVATKELPAKGAVGTLSKHFQTSIGSLKTSGWMEIASVKVEEASGKTLKLVVTRMKSKMTVNGKPVDHFKPKTKVKLTMK